MDIDSDRTGTWRYYVHSGKVYCPQRNADVDVAGCYDCVYLESDPASGQIACLPPPGRCLAEMIDTVARH